MGRSRSALARARERTRFERDEPVLSTFLMTARRPARAVRRALLLLSAVGYARIGRERLLEQPRRRALYETVLAHPGIHKRELARRVGGGWGAFMSHFAALVREGFLRTERQGRYELVFAAGVAASGPVIPNDLARRFFDLLPEDGSRLALARATEILTVSAQALKYHARKLETRGLVAVEKERDGVHVRRRVGDVAQPDVISTGIVNGTRM